MNRCWDCAKPAKGVRCYKCRRAYERKSHCRHCDTEIPAGMTECKYGECEALERQGHYEL